MFVCWLDGWLVGLGGKFHIHAHIGAIVLKVKIGDDHSCDFQIRVVVNTQEL